MRVSRTIHRVIKNDEKSLLASSCQLNANHKAQLNGLGSKKIGLKRINSNNGKSDEEAGTHGSMLTK